jgi:mevalonate kinase
MEVGTLTVCILSSTLAAAIVTSAKDIFLANSKRKDAKEDKEDDRNEKLIQYMERQRQTDQKVEELVSEVHKYMADNNELMNNIIKSNKLIMLDRIKYIASRCIKEGEIKYEDRKLLHDMWDEYHNAWHGNGDLNLIMETIDELPLNVK